MEQMDILSSLIYHTKNYPNRHILSILDSRDYKKISHQLTNKQLFNNAYHLAQQLKKLASRKDRALLCYPAGSDFIIAFFACLMAEIYPVPVVVPSNLGLIRKLSTIADDCEPSLLLTSSTCRTQCAESHIINKHKRDFPILGALVDLNSTTTTVLETDGVVSDIDYDENDTALPSINMSQTAFLQYTSGSIGKPKGVIVSFANLADNLHSMYQQYQLEPEVPALSWLPHTHDMGLIGCILLGVYANYHLYLQSPFTFMRNPISWLKAISYYKIRITASPCFALQMCINKISNADIESMNLSALKHLVVGSEPIVYSVVQQFFERLSKCHLSTSVLVPSYGLAEATLMVSTRQGLQTKKMTTSFNTEKELISCGPSYQDIKIIHQDTGQICHDEEVGEICIKGKSISSGYWHSSHTLHPSDQPRTEDYFYTGDLGFISNGELYVTGRKKELIIVNGVNNYPHDIEEVVKNCSESLLNCSVAAFPYRKEHDATDALVILIKAPPGWDELKKSNLLVMIRKTILQVFQLVPHDIRFINQRLPKTTSGKLQRLACLPLYESVEA